MSGRVLIGSLVGGAINRGLVMGQEGPGLFFVGYVRLDSLWRRGLEMFLYGLFPLHYGHSYLVCWVCFGPASIVGGGS